MAVDQLEGFESLSKALDELGLGDGGKAVRFATRKAAKEVHERAQTNAPVGKRPSHKTYKGRTVSAGFGKRNIIMKMRSGAKRDGVATRYTAFIGPIKEAFYMSQFVELGKDTKHKQAPQPWLRPAMRNGQGEAVSTFKDEMRKKIDRIAKANAKKKA